MTYQPPPSGGTPPPPGGTPPPPGGFGPPGGRPGRPAFDPKSVHQVDWVLVGIGALLLIFSFFDYYSFKACAFNTCVSASFSAWHTAGGTWLAWLAMIVGVAGGVFVAIELFADVRTSVPNRLIALGLFAASFVLYVIAIFAHSNFGPHGGHGFSFWLSLVLALAGTVLSLMRAQQTATPLPGRLAELPNISDRAPRGGLGAPAGLSGPAPQQTGYAPPQGPPQAAPPQAPPPQGPPPASGYPPPGSGYPPHNPQQPPQSSGQPPQQ